MSKVTWEHIKDCSIGIGLFIPLFSFMDHLLEIYKSGITIFNLTFTEQISLVALIIIPLLVLRLLGLVGCQTSELLGIVVRKSTLNSVKRSGRFY